MGVVQKNNCIYCGKHISRCTNENIKKNIFGIRFCKMIMFDKDCEYIGYNPMIPPTIKK